MIKYPAKCFKCGVMQEPGRAFLHKRGTKWFAHCETCYRGPGKKLYHAKSEEPKQETKGEG